MAFINNAQGIEQLAAEKSAPPPFMGQGRQRGNDRKIARMFPIAALDSPKSH